MSAPACRRRKSSPLPAWCCRTELIAGCRRRRRRLRHARRGTLRWSPPDIQPIGSIKTARQDPTSYGVAAAAAISSGPYSRHLASRSTPGLGSNLHRASLAHSAPPPAISCLGASRTPARASRPSSRRHPRNLHRLEPQPSSAVGRQLKVQLPSGTASSECSERGNIRRWPPLQCYG